MGRVEDLREKLKELDADGMLVTKIENVSYMTGFSGSSAFAYISYDTRSLLTDGRYKDQAAGNAPAGTCEYTPLTSSKRLAGF